MTGGCLEESNFAYITSRMAQLTTNLTVASLMVI